MSNVNLMDLVRDKIKSLKAYHVDNSDCGIKLHANENPYPPPAELLALFKNTLDEFQLNRYPDPDSLDLRTTLSDKLGIPTESLIIGNGSDELIQLLMQIFCDAGDTIAFPDPTFAMYSIIAQGQGLTPVTVPLDETWDFKAGQFQEAIATHRPRILFFSYPNNPTGNCFSDKEIKEVLESFEGIVVVDEAYYDFSRKSFIREMKNHNNLIILRSLSKIGLAGLRVGYLAAHPTIVDQINKVRLPYNSNTVSQVLTNTLVKNFAPVQKQIDIIIQERERLVRALGGITSVKVFRSDANFILFRVERGGNIFFQNLMENGVLIRNLGSHPRMENCLRVTVGTPEENERFLEQTMICAG